MTMRVKGEISPSNSPPIWHWAAIAKLCLKLLDNKKNEKLNWCICDSNNHHYIKHINDQMQSLQLQIIENSVRQKPQLTFPLFVSKNSPWSAGKIYWEHFPNLTTSSHKGCHWKIPIWAATITDTFQNIFPWKFHLLKWTR